MKRVMPSLDRVHDYIYVSIMSQTEDQIRWSIGRMLWNIASDINDIIKEDLS